MTSHAANFTSDELGKLYHVVQFNPSHIVWGVYRRKKRRGRGNLFRLVAACLRWETAVRQALDLLAQDGDGYEFSVQGESSSAALPDRYDP